MQLRDLLFPFVDQSRVLECHSHFQDQFLVYGKVAVEAVVSFAPPLPPIDVLLIDPLDFQPVVGVVFDRIEHQEAWSVLPLPVLVVDVTTSGERLCVQLEDIIQHLGQGGNR